MSNLTEVLRVIFSGFGIADMPTVSRTFLFLVVILLVVMLIAALSFPNDGPADHPLNTVMGVSTELLKVVVGAFVGALTQSKVTSTPTEG